MKPTDLINKIERNVYDGLDTTDDFTELYSIVESFEDFIQKLKDYASANNLQEITSSIDILERRYYGS